MIAAVKNRPRPHSSPQDIFIHAVAAATRQVGGRHGSAGRAPVCVRVLGLDFLRFPLRSRHKSPNIPLKHSILNAPCHLDRYKCLIKVSIPHLEVSKLILQHLFSSLVQKCELKPSFIFSWRKRASYSHIQTIINPIKDGNKTKKSL